MSNARNVEARPRIVALAGTALLAAGLLLVAVVLPAEYGIDPLGSGRRLGLMPLGTVGAQVAALNAAVGQRGAVGAAVVAPQTGPFHQETVTFALGPHESLEYKYRLDKGRALLYSWASTQPVDFELHAEPDGAPAGYAESYEKGMGRSDAAGTLTTPFSGIHGWYWKNTTASPMSVTLTSAGFYTLAHEFRSGRPVQTRTFSE